MRVGLRFAFLLVMALGCADDRPSVLLVTVDTLRADHLGAYGFSADTSPNLDALAAGSVVFERAVAASSHTAPSHASIMTSRWVSEHSVGPANGVTRLPENEATIAARFRDAGWETAAFISNLMLERRIGLDAGFDTYDDKLTSSEINRRRMRERSAEMTTAVARRWLDAGRDRPFFMWVHYNDPHGPYTPPPPHDGIVVPDDGRFSASPTLPILGDQMGFQGIPAYQRLAEIDNPSEYRRRYAGEIQSFDASLGQLLANAERAAAPRALLVLFTADHGESLGEGDIYFGHGHGTTPELAHVPLLFRAPGIEPGRRNELAHHVDVLPTLLELAGLPVPEDASGVALGPVARGEAELETRTVFSDIGIEVSAYRGDRLMRARVGETVGHVAQGAWDGFHWFDAGGSLYRPAPPEPELRNALQAYMQNRAPMLRANPLDATKKAMLRALGYLPPERPK